jgi:ADP-ribosylglycohydrolase
MNFYQAEKVRGMLLGMFIGDALAMPVHWYYDTEALQQDYGPIRDMQAPKEFHPNSLLHLSNTGGHGRGKQHGSIIGDVILKGRKEFWAKPKLHYHHALRAGENTLNLQCLRVLLRSATPDYSTERFLAAYVDFMTSEDTHQDTYAESFHRDFFANWAKGKNTAECAGAEDHNTASVGGLILLPPVLVKSSGDWLTVRAQLRLTHRSPKLEHYAEPMMQLLHGLLQQENTADLWDQLKKTAQTMGVGLPKLLEEAERKNWQDQDVIGPIFSPACYIEHSVPSALYLLAKYEIDAEHALIANTEAGGDNGHRGAILGAILGAAGGTSVFPKRWIEQLHEQTTILEEIEHFIESVN